MGDTLHHVIVVSSENDAAMTAAHRQATLRLCHLVSPIVRSRMNNVSSFFVAPDGSYDGRATSDEFDAARDAFIEWLESSGVGPLEWVEVQYGSWTGFPNMEPAVRRASGPARDVESEGL